MFDTEGEISRLGILGGTGALGRGLARRLAIAGVEVVLGSRSLERAEKAAAGLGQGVIGAENSSATDCPVVIVAVPWPGHDEILTSSREKLAGKLVIDCVNPLAFDADGPYPLPVREGSACQQAQSLLPGSTVVGAFHHLSAVTLLDESITDVDSDVLVVGDHREPVARTQRLAESIKGVRALHAGDLRNSRQVEAMTANLIFINRQYKAHAGIRITDV